MIKFWKLDWSICNAADTKDRIRLYPHVALHLMMLKESYGVYNTMHWHKAKKLKFLCHYVNQLKSALWIAQHSRCDLYDHTTIWVSYWDHTSCNYVVFTRGSECLIHNYEFTALPWSTFFINMSTPFSKMLWVTPHEIINTRVFFSQCTKWYSTPY